MKLSLVPVVIASIAVALPLTMLARTLDPELRSCMQQAVGVREDSLFDSFQTYNREAEDSFDKRRQAYSDAWDREDDQDQRQIQRDADRTYSQEVNDARKRQKDRDRETQNAFRNDERRCKDEQRARSLASRSSSRFSSSRVSNNSAQRWCFGNTQCGAGGYYCNMSPGICESPCDGPDDHACVQVCAGRCERI